MKPAQLEIDNETSPPPPPDLYIEVCFLPSKQSDVVLVLRLAYGHLYQALLPVSLHLFRNFNLYIQISLSEKQQGKC